VRHLPVTSGTGKLLRSVFVPTYARLRTPALEVSNRSAQELGSLHRINMCGPPKTAKYIKRSRRTVDKHRANQGSNTGPRGPPPHFNDETFATTTQSRKYTRRLEGVKGAYATFRSSEDLPVPVWRVSRWGSWLLRCFVRFVSPAPPGGAGGGWVGFAGGGLSSESAAGTAGERSAPGLRPYLSRPLFRSSRGLARVRGGLGWL
jgi:hypothetical protein